MKASRLLDNLHKDKTQWTFVRQLRATDVLMTKTRSYRQRSADHHQHRSVSVSKDGRRLFMTRVVHRVTALRGEQQRTDQCHIQSGRRRTAIGFTRYVAASDQKLGGSAVPRPGDV